MKNAAKFKIQDAKLPNYLLGSRQNHTLVGWGGRPLVEPTSAHAIWAGFANYCFAQNKLFAGGALARDP